jgi:16S rRNA (uracil1498-N3)-methyltransferase
MAGRYYCPAIADSDTVSIQGDEAHHLLRSMRIAPGDPVELFDGQGSLATARVTSVARDRVEATIVHRVRESWTPPLDLALFCATPRGDRFDWLVEKATELGVQVLVPLLLERSVVHPGEGKLSKARRTIVEAAKQCGRPVLMEIREPRSLPDALALALAEHRDILLADRAGSEPHAWPRLVQGARLALFIGPEGGFTPSEQNAITHAPARSLAFAPTTLRIETAAIAGAGALFARAAPPPGALS